jgi:hypothetical protein
MNNKKIILQITVHIFLHGHGMNKDRKKDTDKQEKTRENKRG